MAELRLSRLDGARDHRVGSAVGEAKRSLRPTATAVSTARHVRWRTVKIMPNLPSGYVPRERHDAGADEPGRAYLCATETKGSLGVLITAGQNSDLYAQWQPWGPRQTGGSTS